MKKLSYVFSILIFALFVGCSSYKPPMQYDVVTTQEIDVPFDKVWERLISKFAEIDMPFKVIDKSSGLLTTDKIASGSLSDSFMDCGTPAESVGYQYVFEDRNIKVNIVVTKLSETRTKVMVKSVSEAIYVCYKRANFQWYKVDQVKIACNSKGTMEALVFNICKNG